MSDYDPKSVEGIPESGVERLEQNRQGLYTSDLSVNEFMPIAEAGFDPVGLVVGSSIFHIGIQVAGPTKSRELDTLSQAMYSARHLAMTRMEEEADQLGADGSSGSASTSAATTGGRTWPSSSRSGPRSSTVTGSLHRARTAGHSRAISQARSSGRCCAPDTARWEW